MEWLFAAALLGLGALLWKKAGSALLLRRRMRRWPRVEGTVRRAWIHTSSGRNPSSRARFEISLSHDGRELLARSDSPTRAGHTDGRGARADLEAHPVGSRVLVYLEPERQDTCFLKLPEPHVIALLAMGGLLLIGAACVATLTRLPPQHEETAILLFFLACAAALAGVAVAVFVALLKKGLVSRPPS